MARVVVVGGGLGGTASAARLAKLGHEVTLVEARDRLGGDLGLLARDGFVWDAGTASTALPAVLRDLFRKSGRTLDRELDLVPADVLREHRFADGSVLTLPGGGRSAQLEAVDAALGAGLGRAWVDHVHGFARTWDALRRARLERPYDPGVADPATEALLRTRTSLHRAVRSSLRDPRLRDLAWWSARLDGHDPRDVPAWVGMWDYVEQAFGVCTVPGGLGRLADALTRRLAERRVAVLLGTTVDDVRLEAGRAVGVTTGAGPLDAEVVVVAVDPRRLPVLAPLVARTTPALPPVVSHLGLVGDVPDLPHEVVLHGDPLVVLRTGGTAPEGGAAWTVLVRGRLQEDVLVAMARRGVDVRAAVRVRVDRSPLEQVEALGGSSYGVRWQGRTTLRRTLAGNPLPGVYAAGVHVAAGSALPLVALTAATLAERVGPAD